jgi:thioredoxin-related protein
MSSILVTLLGILLFTNTGSNMNNGNSRDLQWTDYTDGVRKASAENKKVLIDVYTDWCGWCKKMEKDTYSDENIKSYLTQNYILVRLNAESNVKETVGQETMTQAEIAKAYRVDGYPTTIFLSADGQPITSVPGYLKADEFMQVLKFIGGDYYKKMEFQDYLNSQKVPAK